MSLLGAGETVTVLTCSTTTDRYGNTVDTWSDPAEFNIDGCLFAPGASQELLDARQGTSSQAVLYVPANPGVTIDARSRFTIRGGTWEADGVPDDWRDPFGGQTGGLAVSVRRVAG